MSNVSNPSTIKFVYPLAEVYAAAEAVFIRSCVLIVELIVNVSLEEFAETDIFVPAAIVKVSVPESADIV